MPDNFPFLSHNFSFGSFHEVKFPPWAQQMPVIKQRLQGSEPCEYLDKDIDTREQALPLVHATSGEW